MYRLNMTAFLLLVLIVSPFNALGSYEVLPDGSFASQFSIVTPSSEIALKPNLSLSYNSNNRRNGILGIGWTLEGLPAINRINNITPVTHSNADVLISPDGILTRGGVNLFFGTNAPWNKYEPKFINDPFINAGDCVGANNTPCSWEASDKNGLTWQFGGTNDSRIEALGHGGVVRTWALNKVIDPFGKAFEVEYYEDKSNGAYYPTKIWYSNYTISFHYNIDIESDKASQRPDPILQFGQLSRVLINHRLQAITIKSGTEVFRKYRFNYKVSEDDNSSLLVGITEEGGDGKYKNDTRFVWPKLKESFKPVNLGVNGFGRDAGTWRVSQHPRMMSDVNGDGRADIIGFGNAGVYVSLSEGSKFSSPKLWVASYGQEAGTWRAGQHPRMMSDVNGDGLADVVGFGNAGVYVSLSEGNRFSTPKLWVASYGQEAGTWRVSKHPRIMSDVNGDGRADIVGFGNAGVYVSLSEGNKFSSPKLWVASYGQEAGTWRVGQHPRMMSDVNGDGRADIIGFGNAGVYVSLSEGNKFSSPKLWVASYGQEAGTWRVGQHPRMMSDVNGDGLADVVGFGNAGVYVSLSEGNKFSSPKLWVASYGQEAGTWRVSQHPRMAPDVNGDGRADIVGFGNAGVYVSLSKGNKFTAPKLWVASYGQEAGTWRVSQHPRAVADINGDGSPDIVGFGNVGVYTSLSPTTSKTVSKITTPIGKEVLIQYSEFHNANSHQLIEGDPCNDAKQTGYQKSCGNSIASAQLVVKHVLESDGRPDTGWATDNVGDFDRWVTYDYSSPRMFNGPVDVRKSLGFRRVQSQTRVGIKTEQRIISSMETEYRQQTRSPDGEIPLKVLKPTPLSGLPIKNVQYESLPARNNRISEEKFSYYEQTDIVFPHKGISDVFQILLKTKSKGIYEAGYIATKLDEQYEFDQFGREVRKTTCTTITGGSANCLKLKTTYLPWALGISNTYNLPSKVKAKSGTNIVSSTKFSYTDSGSISLLDKIEKLYCPASENCNENAGRWITIRSGVEYTADYLVRSEVNSDGLMTIYGHDVEGRVNRIDRRSEEQNFSTKLVYDLFGNLTKKVGENGEEHTFGYDGLGRLILKKNPNGGIYTYSYVDFGKPNLQYKETTVSDHRSVIRDVSLSKVSTREYFDGFYFVYLTKTFTSGNEDENLIQIENGEHYKGIYKITNRSNPYGANEKKVWTTSTYDTRGRILQIKRPDGSQLSYGYTSNEKTTTVNHGTRNAPVIANQIERYNSDGQLAKIIDHDGNTVDFVYNSAGKLTTVHLPLDKTKGTREIISIAYDSFGRKTSHREASHGQINFEYTLSGRIKTVIDATGQKISYKYDQFGRIKEKLSTYSSGSIKSRARYEYDKASDGNYPLNRLTKIRDNSGATKFQYDQSGRVVRREFSLAGHANKFVERFKYSAFDKPLLYIFPDGTEQAFEYSDIGQLEQVLVNQAGDFEEFAFFEDYNSLGQMTSKILKNGTRTVYDYNENGGLRELKTCHPGCDYPGNPRVIQHLSYEFTESGYVKSIKDQRDSSNKIRVLGSGERVNTDSTEIFNYDTAGRLASVFFGGISDPVKEGRQYVYNEIGNLTRVNKISNRAVESFVSYTYDGQQILNGFMDERHSEEKKVFESNYDDNGNLTQKINWEEGAKGRQKTNELLLNYDSMGRLSEVLNAGMSGSSTITSFEYDHKNQRRLKVSNSSSNQTTSVWYISPAFEIHKMGETISVKKYIIAGDKGRIALIDTKLSNKEFLKQYSIGPAREGAAPKSSNVAIAGSSEDESVAETDDRIFFYHTNNIGSATVVTDHDGKEVSRLFYEPFGKIIHEKSFGTDLIAHKYSGHVFDSETGLIYMNARYYDPDIHRFVSPDNVVPDYRNPQAFNRYAYVYNNPILYRDPSGNFAITTAIIVGAVIGGVTAGIQSDWDPEAVLRGAFIGGASAGVGAWASTAAAAGGAGAFGAGLSGGAAAGATSGGLSATLSGGSFDDVLKSTVYGGAMGAITGSLGSSFYGATEGTAPTYLSRPAFAYASARLMGQNDQAAREAALHSLGKVAVSWAVSPSEGRPLTSAEKTLLSKESALKDLDLDKIRIRSGGIYTWGGSAVTMDNEITFPSSDFHSDYSAQSIDDQGWLVHEAFHVMEYQDGHYHWTDAAMEHFTHPDPYKTGKHESAAAKVQQAYKERARNVMQRKP